MKPPNSIRILILHQARNDILKVRVGAEFSHHLGQNLPLAMVHLEVRFAPGADIVVEEIDRRLGSKPDNSCVSRFRARARRSPERLGSPSLTDQILGGSIRFGLVQAARFLAR